MYARVMNPYGCSDEQQSEDFCKHYEAQRGGSIPVFAGGRIQRGGGLGGIFRGLFRRLIPLLRPMAEGAITGFITNAASGIGEGKKLGDAAKDAILPALGTGVAEGMKARKSQTGGSRKRKGVYKAGSGRKSKISKFKKVHFNF